MPVSFQMMLAELALQQQLLKIVSQHCECAYMYACKIFGVESD